MRLSTKTRHQKAISDRLEHHRYHIAALLLAFEMLNRNQVSQLTPAEHKRRKGVENQDYEGRTRSSGLQHLADIFDSCYKLIHEQQRLAGLVLEHGNSLTSESAALLELQEAHARYEIAIAGIDREKMAEIQEMLDTFNAEFRCG